MKMDVLMLGRPTGDFHPAHFPTQNEFYAVLSDRLLRSSKREPFTRVVVPRRAFGSNIVPSKGREFEFHGEVFAVPKKPADGVIITSPKHAALLLPADCMTVLVAEEAARGNRMAVLHVGYRSLFDGGSKRPTILDALFDRYGFQPKEISVQIGWGIGPCCFGVDHHPVISGIEYARAARGPREGQRSVDLRKIIRDQLVARGVPVRAITLHGECTACAECCMPQDGFLYHSHCRDGVGAGRNALLAWFMP